MTEEKEDTWNIEDDRHEFKINTRTTLRSPFIFTVTANLNLPLQGRETPSGLPSLNKGLG